MKCESCKHYDPKWPCGHITCYSLFPDDYRKPDFFEPKEQAIDGVSGGHDKTMTEQLLETLIDAGTRAYKSNHRGTLFGRRMDRHEQVYVEGVEA